MARRKFPHPISYGFGPVQGMQDSPSPKLQKPTLATDLLNVVPDISGGGGLVGRPGFDRISATQMGSLGARVGQAIIHHITAAGGTHYTFFVNNAKVWRLVWDGTLTDVTPVGVSISTSSSIYSCSFGDHLIVTDGVNRPWKMTSLDSTPVVGTYLTGMTAAAYGPPTVYYAKLFFIKIAEKSTIVWSEENDPDTGYEAGGYNNAWTLSQTSNDPIQRLWGTNAALYYFRATSSGAITGAVSTDFVNAGVHDSVSQTVGTRSPAAFAQVDQRLYFLDQNGFPHRLSIGAGEPEPLWRDIAETLTAYGTTASAESIGRSHAAYVPDLDMVLFAHPRYLDGSALERVLAFHDPSSQWFGAWEMASSTAFSAMATVTPTDPSSLGPEEQTVVVLDRDGYAYRLTLQQENDQWDRLDGSTATAVAHTVTTPILGYSETVQQQFDRVDLTVRGFASNAPTYSVTWATPRTAGTTQSLAFTAPVAANRDVKASLGINAYGRGCSLTITHSSATTRFSLHHAQVSGQALSDAPNQY